MRQAIQSLDIAIRPPDRATFPDLSPRWLRGYSRWAQSPVSGGQTTHPVIASIDQVVVSGTPRPMSPLSWHRSPGPRPQPLVWFATIRWKIASPLQQLKPGLAGVLPRPSRSGARTVRIRGASPGPAVEHQENNRSQCGWIRLWLTGGLLHKGRQRLDHRGGDLR